MPRPRKGIQVAIASALTCAGLLLALPATGSAASFEFRNFKNVDALKLNGDAHQEGKFLRLTDAAPEQAGSAFTRKLRVDPKKNFKTRFRLDMSEGGSLDPADGMTFTLHRGPARALGADGGSLGYYESWWSGTLADPSVAVGFQTWFSNSVFVDRNGNWIDSNAAPFDLNDGPFNVWVNYNAAKKKLKVFLSEETTRPESPLLNAGINLRGALGGPARAGFTAGTGDDFVAHDVRSWSMRN